MIWYDLQTAGVNGVARQYSLRKRLANLDVKAKVLITLKYNKATSVLSLVVHKATNLQVHIGAQGRKRSSYFAIFSNIHIHNCKKNNLPPP